MIPRSTIGSRVWVKDLKVDLIEAEVVEDKGDKVDVKNTSGETVGDVDVKNVFPRYVDLSSYGVDDIHELAHLHEKDVVQNLRSRFDIDQIYTYMGNALIAVNPFKRLLWGQNLGMEQYKNLAGVLWDQNLGMEQYKKLAGVFTPHPFSIADAAYRNMTGKRENQSIIVSGVSGSSKTETTKMLMHYFVYMDGRPQAKEWGVEQKLLESNTVLEAFGNAKTISNNNSSRFGKFVQIQFDDGGKIYGASFKTYLLECSRVCESSDQERNYHCFYMLRAAPPELLKEFQLEISKNFHYLNQSNIYGVDAMVAQQDYRKTILAMDKLGFSGNEKDSIFRVVAAILHLGNINFAMGSDTESSIPKDKDSRFHLNTTSKLLRCNKISLTNSLCERVSVTENRTISVGPASAVLNRDALAKVIYSRLFDWIVDKINKAINQHPRSKYFIGVLEIHGFDSSTVDSFEQFCLNFTKEKLMQHFHQMELEEHTNEGIDSSDIKFQDNQDVIELLEEPIGILSIFNDACKFGTHKLFSEELFKSLANHKRFSIGATRSDFTIHHCDGDVTYQIEHFLEKNALFVVNEHQGLLSTSECPFVSNLFLLPKCLPSTFEELQSLFEIVKVAVPHFICCVKPNGSMDPFVFDNQIVLEQLNQWGVMEVIRSRWAGFPTRISFVEFLDRFSDILDPEMLEECSDAAACEKILVDVGFKDYEIGKTRVFLRAGQIAKLDETIRDIIHKKKADVSFQEMIDTQTEEAATNIKLQTTPSSQIGSNVWVKISQVVWMGAEVLDENGDKITVRNTSGEIVRDVDVEDVFPRDVDLSSYGVDDMTELAFGHEPGVMQNLRIRFDIGQIYTCMGNILIAVNPFKRIVMHDYKEDAMALTYPYAIVHAAYKDMADKRKSHSIYVSGATGAGKTETTKMLLKYLGRTQSKWGPTTEQKLFKSNTVLEAFGNAKTLNNNNSSRFSKFVEIQFDGGKISGFSIKTYSLERSRVCQVSDGERNYHCFYMLRAAPPEVLKEFQLENPRKFHYLNQHDIYGLDAGVAQQDYRKTILAMDALGISNNEKDSIFRVVAAILHLGNINFAMGTDACSSILKDEDSCFHLNTAAKLLRCNKISLTNTLCNRGTVTLKKPRKVEPLLPVSAAANRDDLAKFIYTRLFDWIVKKINKSIGQDPPSNYFIGIMEIYGDSCMENSLEQLCFNFTREKLKQRFNQMELEEHTNEKIDIKFQDNQDVIKLFEGVGGIFSLFNNAIKSAHPILFSEGLFGSLIGHEHFRLGATKRDFTVRHYDGDVTYQMKHFWEMNVLLVVNEHQGLLSTSDCSFIQNLFLPTKSSPTIFEELQCLFESVKVAVPHFICCVKPNGSMDPFVFDNQIVLEQLNQWGVMEATRVRFAEFPTRKLFAEFLGRFRTTLDPEVLEGCSDDVACKKILVESALEGYKIGVKSVFLRAGQMAQLNVALRDFLHKRTIRADVQFQDIIHELAARRAAIDFKAKFEELEVYFHKQKRLALAGFLNRENQVENRKMATSIIKTLSTLKKSNLDAVVGYFSLLVYDVFASRDNIQGEDLTKFVVSCFSISLKCTGHEDHFPNLAYKNVEEDILATEYVRAMSFGSYNLPDVNALVFLEKFVERIFHTRPRIPLDQFREIIIKFQQDRRSTTFEQPVIAAAAIMKITQEAAADKECTDGPILHFMASHYFYIEQFMILEEGIEQFEERHGTQRLPQFMQRMERIKSCISAMNELRQKQKLREWSTHEGPAELRKVGFELNWGA